MAGMKVGGKLIGDPVPPCLLRPALQRGDRCAEKGFTKPPATIEEMVEIAKACTYRRADGTAGASASCMPGVTYPNVIDIARAWDGDFITPDYKCVADQPPMLNAIKLLRELFEAGAFPRNFATLSTEDVNVWMQQGRAAMSLQSMGRNRIYNDPAEEQIPRQDQDRRRADLGDADRRNTRSRRPRSSSGAWSSRRTPSARTSSWSFIKAMAVEAGDADGRAQRQRPGARLDL